MGKFKKGICSKREVATHVHDSITFKECRRKWYLSSPFGRHLQKKAEFGVAEPLWLGSGFHFAMEDYFGYNRFGGLINAFEEYAKSFPPEECPDNVEEVIELGKGMLTTFQEWADEHKNWKVVWVDDKPLVEEAYSLVLEEASYYETPSQRYFWNAEKELWEGDYYHDYMTAEELQHFKFVEVVAHGKFDAIVEDENGGWWVADYKTAKAFDTAKLSRDPQISRYCWAAEQWLDHEIEGMLYIQVSKTVPKKPKIGKTGVSVDARQKVTYKAYREALLEYYHDMQYVPAKNIQFLNELASRIDEHGNEFVRIDWVPRLPEERLSHYEDMIAELRDSLNSHLRIYPNPTRDCSWKCPFKDICEAYNMKMPIEPLLDEYEVRNETMNDELPKWEQRMRARHPEIWPPKSEDELLYDILKED